MARHFMLIFWLLFIYLSLSAMDEMIELFSVINQLEKGALGLFFEMNYFVGIVLSGYIFWFINKFNPPIAKVPEN
jgi:cytosine/uracil/thiamine/allantoin permease